MVSEMKNNFIWLRCLFGHKYVYDIPKETEGKWYRDCKNCGKKEYAIKGQHDDSHWFSGWKRMHDMYINSD